MAGGREGPQDGPLHGPQPSGDGREAATAASARRGHAWAVAVFAGLREGASVGPFIHLVQAEILAGIRMLAQGELDPGMHEVSATDRATIAATWLNYFNR